MNKKEISELKRNFTDSCGFFTMGHILRAFVDADKNIVYSDNRLIGTIPEEDQELIYDTMRKGLSGSLGKNLIEYSFPNSAYEEGAPQWIMYNAMREKFRNEELNQAFLHNITENIDYVSTFVIFAAHCTYTLFKKDKNEEKTEDNSDYNFILTVICPVETCGDELIFDSEENKIRKRPKNDRIISRTPTDAFLFPTLCGGEPDVNSVLCYSAKPKEPNVSLVEQVLGCEAAFTAAGEKAVFGKVLEEVMGSDLDYTIITKVNEKIGEEIKEHRFDEKPATIDENKLRDILFDAGVEDKRLNDVSRAYSEKVGKKPLTASNLVSPKTVIATPEITINISKTATEKVRTSLIGGRRCLVIDLDDPNITINGLPTTVEMPAQADTAPKEEAEGSEDREEDYAF